jgi:chemotaxis protein MotB
MARKKVHEEHANHEAWAIPYGDLITLLLALFVVMYAVSSINEGKYRVLSDAMSSAFGGPPKSLKPIQFGGSQKGANGAQYLNMPKSSKPSPPPPDETRDLHNPRVIARQILTLMPSAQAAGEGPGNAAGLRGERAELRRMAKEIEQALAALIRQDLVIVRKSAAWLEVEIKTDILFASGSAELAASARPTLEKLATILQPYPHRIRIEGYTDNVPIHSLQFPSNWELSAARAATVLRELMQGLIDPRRLTVLGHGEFRPTADNSTAAGRNRNRRVVIVVLADSAAGEMTNPAVGISTPPRLAEAGMANKPDAAP